ncbi:MAG: XRE family transcriptional regulator [Candidatus Pacebacteria bacterium]|nr:XRE family transcriptional regulator [Candidatus Paceibacterota bacterium]MDD4333931.1 XRE family transcriptional regulator [Candidatus Paceibacterota bacterium]
MGKVNFINKENLKIARENAGIDSFEASKKISKVKRNLVAEWEEGESLPTWVQVSKLAKFYNISEFLLFSEKPIEKQRAVKDYRKGSFTKEDDKDVLKLINIVITRQRWVEKYVKEAGLIKNKLQGLGKDINDPKKLAELIAKSLEIEIEEVKKTSSYCKDPLKYYIEKAENKGIFIGKTLSYHKISVEAMRGLFIANDYTPFIILNRKDSKSAQIFSLAHELAHFFRKSESISNVDFRDKNTDKEEVFCNKTAAELLLPEEEIENRFYGEEGISALALTYKISKLFVFYRLKSLKRIRAEDESYLEQKINNDTNIAILKKNESKSVSGNYINSMKDSNGSLFNKIVYENYASDKMGYTEATRLLLFSPEKI